MGSIHEKNRGRKSRDTAPLIWDLVLALVIVCSNNGSNNGQWGSVPP